MNYQSIYNQLIEFRKTNPPTGYTENHHILPRSMGGSDDKSNLVNLTGREHWIAHLLLWKIHRNPQCLSACHMMAMRCEERGIPRIRNSRVYEAIRVRVAKVASDRNKSLIGKKNSQFGTRWICNVELRQNKKISKDCASPPGWIVGRNAWNRLPTKTKLSQAQKRAAIIAGARNRVAEKEKRFQAIRREFLESGLNKSDFIKLKIAEGLGYKSRMLYNSLRGYSSTVEQ